MLISDKRVRRRLSLGMQIIAFSSAFLITLPWLGYRYIDEMKEFLVKGQGDAQLLSARAIATVLHNRSDLFHISNIPGDALIEESSLYVYPLKYKLTIDGYGSDWDELLSIKKYFGAESVVYDRTSGAIASGSFGLLLGEYDKYIYGLLNVRDSDIVYRHPRYARLDSSDQVRIELVDNDGEIKRYVLLAEAPGNASVYEMQKDWVRPVTGKPNYALSAIWKDTTEGYDVEFRFPKKWLNDDQYLMISIADVNSSVERKIDTVVATLSGTGEGVLNRLISRSAGLDRIIQGLGYSDANVCIVDQYRRIRAVLGSNAQQSQLCSLTDKVAPDLVAKALIGKSDVHRTTYENNDALVVASHPIYQEEDIIGVVLVEKNSTNILAEQRASLNKIIVATAAVFLVALVGLFLFSSLLAYRIRRLQREVTNAFDPEGRLIKAAIVASSNAGDEVGELSRVFSTLLSQLKSYTGFLESVPRTLRHEILNPLNTISMTLQKMSADNPYDKTLIDSGKKAIRQLELIVHSLTEAAHIDDALSQDEKDVFDLAELLSEYVSNTKLKDSDNAFLYTGPKSGIHIQGSDLRIIQLLDKLKDNAIDFSTRGTEIRFELVVDQNNQASISICNEGPAIPEDFINNLGDGIMSHRQGTEGEPHLGIGLYVALRIAKYHNGSLKIFNRDSMDGVCVTTLLPTYSTS